MRFEKYFWWLSALEVGQCEHARCELYMIHVEKEAVRHSDSHFPHLETIKFNLLQ